MDAILNNSKRSMMPAGHHSDSDATLLPLPKSPITWFGSIFARLPPLAARLCSVCAYTCVTIFNYAEVLACFAEDWCNLRCAEVHASQTLQILFTTVKTIVKAGALFKHGAHSNLDTTATLSIRQRPTSSASCIARLQFLRWGSVRFSSRV